jgi:hypothetical protein
MSSIARILACAQTQGAKRPTPTQSTCLYYDHDNEASKCGDRAQKMSRLFVRVKLFRDFYILKNI